MQVDAVGLRGRGVYCIANTHSGMPMGKSEEPGPHDPTFLQGTRAPCSGLPQPPPHPSCSGSGFHICLLHKTLKGSNPTLDTLYCPTWDSFAEYVKHSNVKNTIIFCASGESLLNLLKLLFNYVLYPRLVATGKQSSECTLCEDQVE